MSMTSLAPGSQLGLQCQVQFPIVVWVFSSVRQLLVPTGMWVPFAVPSTDNVAMLVVVMVHKCCSWLGNCVLSLTVYIMFCDAMEARLLERGSDPGSNHLDIVFYMWGVLSHEGLPWTPEKQPRATSVAYIVPGGGHIFSPSTWKVVADRYRWVQGQPELQSESQDSQSSYRETLKLK